MSQFEFHISRKAREKYQFDEQLFALDGRVVLADFAAARRFTEQMTAVRGRPVPAADIYAMGLIDEIMHILIRQYEARNPGMMRRALEKSEVDPDAVLLKFTQDFPPLAVYRKEIEPQRYLDLESAGRPNRQSTLEEMLLLHVSNVNPAYAPYHELFDDTELRLQTAYLQVISGLERFFRTEPGLGAGGETLLDALTAPARIAPHSLTEQLEFLLSRWSAILGESFVSRILRGLDYARENVLHHTGPGGFGGEAPVLTFTGHDYAEYERFSPDKDWMPRLILIAKNSYVWLDQLSKKYGRWIKTLDQIPDEELDILRQRGITGLWLIGLWERSLASQRIKQMMGIPEAVASAYSLMSYEIANDLGGWEALNNLRGRAWQRAIRLSADMVPNHMGIDSR